MVKVICNFSRNFQNIKYKNQFDHTFFKKIYLIFLTKITHVKYKIKFIYVLFILLKCSKSIDKLSRSKIVKTHNNLDLK